MGFPGENLVRAAPFEDLLPGEVLRECSVPNLL